MKNIILGIVIILILILGGYFLFFKSTAAITVRGTIEPGVEGCSVITTSDNKSYIVGKKPDDVNYGDLVEVTGKETSEPSICVVDKVFVIDNYSIISTATTTDM